MKLINLQQIYLLEKGNAKTVSAHFAEKNAEYFRVISLVYIYQLSTLKCQQNSDLLTDGSSGDVTWN